MGLRTKNACDILGRTITHAPHYSNCLLHALTLSGRLRMEWQGWCPHFYREVPEGRAEFIYGNFGRNGFFPLLFKGYGVHTRQGSPIK